MLRDPKLLAEYRKGNQAAFIALYERYANPLRRFLQGGFSFSSQGKLCRFRGTDAGMDVEALVQETFARAFASTTRENYDGVRPFQTYLFSIAKNLVLRECHYRDRVVSVDYVEEADESRVIFSSQKYGGFGENPEKKFSNVELRNITKEFIDCAGAEERVYFQSRFSQGLTQEATAKSMGTTRARIKLLEKKVRNQFLEHLRKHGYFVDYTPNPRWRRKASNGAER